MPGLEEDLRDCRRELLRLRNENAALRYSASSFADLAERLNFIVRRHRGLGLLPAASPRRADHSATTAPENPGAQSVRADPGISSLHRLDVAGLDSDEQGPGG